MASRVARWTLIPTRERVYPVADRGGFRAGPERRAPTHDRERGEADREVRKFLEENRIGPVDLLPPLREMVGRAVIDPPDDDGHPTAAGYG
jgi:hypothetical protein